MLLPLAVAVVAVVLAVAAVVDAVAFAVVTVSICFVVVSLSNGGRGGGLRALILLPARGNDDANDADASFFAP